MPWEREGEIGIREKKGNKRKGGGMGTRGTRSACDYVIVKRAGWEGKKGRTKRNGVFREVRDTSRIKGSNRGGANGGNFKG